MLSANLNLQLFKNSVGKKVDQPNCDSLIIIWVDLFEKIYSLGSIFLGASKNDFGHIPDNFCLFLLLDLI